MLNKWPMRKRRCLLAQAFALLFVTEGVTVKQKNTNLIPSNISDQQLFLAEPHVTEK
jgi:hypothetical protein